MKRPVWAQMREDESKSLRRPDASEISASICPDHMKQLANNKELYDYLVDLSTKPGARGAGSLAAIILAASRQSWAKPSA